MSYYGAHPVKKKADAIFALPPRACKHCVYENRIGRVRENFICPRCGVRYDASGLPVATAEVAKSC